MYTGLGMLIEGDNATIEFCSSEGEQVMAECSLSHMVVRTMYVQHFGQ